MHGRNVSAEHICSVFEIDERQLASIVSRGGQA
jgi:hypothetical protein